MNVFMKTLTEIGSQESGTRVTDNDAQERKICYK
jgi:hypothetical protein